MLYVCEKEREGKEKENDASRNFVGKATYLGGKPN